MKKPEPILYLAPDGSIRKTNKPIRFKDWAWRDSDFQPLYSAAVLEEVRRQAFEEAADMCMAKFNNFGVPLSEWAAAAACQAGSLADEIRALIVRDKS